MPDSRVKVNVKVTAARLWGGIATPPFPSFVIPECHIAFHLLEIYMMTVENNGNGVPMTEIPELIKCVHLQSY